MHKKHLILLIALIAVVKLNGQQSFVSPYSIYGIGDVEDRTLAQHTAFGGAKYSIYNSGSANAANPATYAMLFHPVMEVNVSTHQATLQSSNGSQQNGDAFIRSINLGFPAGKNAGFSFGVMPYTRVGYEINQLETNAELGNINYNYRGRGGINQAYLGLSRKLYRDSSTVILIGINALYHFGFIQSTKITQFEEASGQLSTLIDNSGRLNGFTLEGGLFLRRRVGDKWIANLGATYSPTQNIKSSINELAASTGVFNNRTVLKDTAFYRENNTKTKLPGTLGGGLNFEFDRKFNFIVEYQTQGWSELSVAGANQNLSNAWQACAGVQYIPNYAAVSNMLKTIRYKGGFRYGGTRLNVNGTQINEYAASIGISIPFTKSASNSMVHFAGEFGQRGNSNNGLIQENFSRFNIGLTFAPHKFDRWFIRRKIE